MQTTISLQSEKRGHSSFFAFTSEKRGMSPFFARAQTGLRGGKLAAHYARITANN
jgi:hypothetical protein